MKSQLRTQDEWVEDRIPIINLIVTERLRQDELKAGGKFQWTAADTECGDLLRLAMLTEELGEVARALQNQDNENLRDELMQVAAIAFAWVEYLHGI